MRRLRITRCVEPRPTTCPPLFLLTPGVHHTPRWPRPRRPAPAPPCPAVKEPDNGHRDPDRRPLRLPQTPAKETYDFLPSSHFPCLASWIVCALARPLLTTAACDPPPRHCSSSPLSPPSSPLSRFLCSLPKVHTTRPKPPRLRLSLALPPAHAHPHPPWLIIVHLYYYHGPPRPATTSTRLQRAVQPRMPHRPVMPRCHVPRWRLCTKRVRPDDCMI